MTDRWHRLCRNENSTGIVIPSGRRKYFVEQFPRDQMCRYRRIMFGGSYKPCMAGLEDYLSKMYGNNWMKPPEVVDEHHVYLEPFDLGKRVGDL